MQALAATALLLGCLGLRAPQPSTPRGHVLHLERDGQGRPVLPVRLGNTWGRLLVDSGASSHVLAREFLREALGKLPRGEPLGVNGLVGDAQPALLLKDLAVQTHEGLALTLREPVAMAWERDGDDGLLSPQLLAEAGITELDLKGGTLTLDASPDAAAVNSGAERCEPYDNLSALFVAPATVDGRGVPLLIDTGATYSSLEEDSALGQQLSGRALPAGRVRGLGGGASTRAASARLRFAGRDLIALFSLVKGRTQSCDDGGHLGIDVLGDCRLRFGRTALWLACGK